MTVTLVPLVSNYEKLVETRGGGNSGDRRVEGGLVAADPRRTAPSPLGWCSRAQLFERASVRELERVHPASRRNTRETCIGLLEGSNRSRVTGTAANSARDLFEAGLNEAASVEHGLWVLDQHDDGAIISLGRTAARS
jgi:hypothetical protein